MRIVFGALANETKILTDEGKDITADLQVVSISISADAGELTKVSMECYAKSIEAEVPDEQVMTLDIETGSMNPCSEVLIPPTNPFDPFTLAITKPAPKSPELILDQFKIKKVGD